MSARQLQFLPASATQREIRQARARVNAPSPIDIVSGQHIYYPHQ